MLKQSWVSIHLPESTSMFIHSFVLTDPDFLCDDERLHPIETETTDTKTKTEIEKLYL